MEVNWFEVVKIDVKGFLCCFDGICIEMICGLLCILFFIVSGENERVIVSDIEIWMFKIFYLMNFFDIVFLSLF